MQKGFFIAYSAVSYTIGFLGLAYLIGFLSAAVVPFHINNGTAGPIGLAIAINVALIALFTLQHSVMARPTFKTWWTQFVPKPIERSTYVLLSGVSLFALYYFWRPIPEMVWQVENAIGAISLWAIYGFGWFVLLSSTFVIDHFELMGLKQPLKTDDETPVFVTRLYYKVVRHPIMTGFLILVWATPTMTLGHLLFAAMTTSYVLVALQLEERNLIDVFGDKYRNYKKSVPMVIPFTKPRPKTEDSGLRQPVHT